MTLEKIDLYIDQKTTLQNYNKMVQNKMFSCVSR